MRPKSYTIALDPAQFAPFGLPLPGRRDSSRQRRADALVDHLLSIKHLEIAVSKLRARGLGRSSRHISLARLKESVIANTISNVARLQV